MDAWTLERPDAGISLVREPVRSFPFLTDGEDLYVIEEWRAAGRKPTRVSARRLIGAERVRVQQALGDAGEEAYYSLMGRRPRRR